jgi:outer membrane protein OmpA-like peptidoglycan-associated protein
VCADVNFPIYFAKGSDQLSDPARDAILAGAAQVKTCKVSEVDVLGLASVDGGAAANQALSRRRASIVAQTLIAAGMPAPLFDVEGLGESGARTVHGAHAILQRKAEVDIHIAPSAPSAPPVS